MPARVYEADLTVPAGTAIAAAVSAVWALDEGTLVNVRIVVPPGHNGLTGVRVLWAGTPIIPYGGAPYIIANDDKMDWDINQDVNTGSITVQGYNLDIWPHTFYLRGLLDRLGSSMPAGLASVPATQPPAAATLAAISALSDMGPADAGLPAGVLAPLDRSRLGQLPQLPQLAG